MGTLFSAVFSLGHDRKWHLIHNVRNYSKRRAKSPPVPTGSQVRLLTVTNCTFLIAWSPYVLCGFWDCFCSIVTFPRARRTWSQSGSLLVWVVVWHSGAIRCLQVFIPTKRGPLLVKDWMSWSQQQLLLPLSKSFLGGIGFYPPWRLESCESFLGSQPGCETFGKSFALSGPCFLIV
jgi:hypothetical protein